MYRHNLPQYFQDFLLSFTQFCGQAHISACVIVSPREVAKYMEKNLRLGKLWDEWLTSESRLPENDYEASGILMGMKNFQTNRLRTARRLMKVWALTSYYEKYEFTPAVSLITAKNQKPRVKISIPSGKILKLPKGLKSSWAWLKGLFGSTGGLYFPKWGYYLALIIPDVKVSRTAAKALGLTGLAWHERGNEFTLRNHDDIMTFLCNTGMPLTALEFDKTVMLRSLRNRVNVERNYEAANIARTVRAAREQLELAEKFLALSVSLPENLKALAVLRTKFPDDTLDELGKKLNPPIKKSAVKYRWNKIKNILETAEKTSGNEKI